MKIGKILFPLPLWWNNPDWFDQRSEVRGLEKHLDQLCSSQYYRLCLKMQYNCKSVVPTSKPLLIKNNNQYSFYVLFKYFFCTENKITSDPRANERHTVRFYNSCIYTFVCCQEFRIFFSVFLVNNIVSFHVQSNKPISHDTNCLRDHVYHVRWRVNAKKTGFPYTFET